MLVVGIVIAVLTIFVVSLKSSSDGMSMTDGMFCSLIFQFFFHLFSIYSS